MLFKNYLTFRSGTAETPPQQILINYDIVIFLTTNVMQDMDTDVREKIKHK